MDTARILIVDDDPSLRKTLADIFRVKGYETLAAGAGREGAGLLETHPVHVVLIDLGLPDMSGLELLDRVRAGHPGTEAIILTGNATLDSAIEATNRGAFSYMLKPYDMEQLMLQVRRAIEKQQARQAIARHSADLERVNAELKVLHDVSAAISRKLDMDELVSEVLHALVRAEIFPFEVRGAIFLVEEGRMRLASFGSLSETALTPCREIHRRKCLCGTAMTTGEVVVSRNPAEEGRTPLCHPPTEPHGRIVVPLKAVDKVVGLLTFYTPPGTEVGEEMRRLLTSLGSQIGIALNNASLYEATKASSLHDPLTGLGNRRFLEAQLGKSFGAAKRYGETLSIIMLDIDHFKRYNDAHGHPEGDALLKRIAGILSQEMRGSDHAFRYGGEEFLIVLTHADPARARNVAERLRKSIEEAAGVTVSLGVATFEEGIREKEQLVKMADEALYRAKQGGRNRVEVARGKGGQEMLGVM